VPTASRVLTRSEPRKPPATAGHNLRRILRRVLRYRIHAPPATRNQADVARARRATPSISAGRSVGPARADAYIAAAQPSQPRRNVPGSIRRFGRTPSYRSATPPATGCKRPPRFGVSVEKRGPQCFPPRPRYLMSVAGSKATVRRCLRFGWRAQCGHILLIQAVYRTIPPAAFISSANSVTFPKRSMSNRPMTGSVTRWAIEPAKIGSQEQKCVAQS
jgi:hypothetical protein